MPEKISRRSFFHATAFGGMMAAAHASRAEVTRMQGVAVKSSPANDPAGNADQVGLTPSHKWPETVSTLLIEDPARFRVLQFTDIHFFGVGNHMERDPGTIADMQKIVELTQPDLLLLTGDLWSDNPGGHGEDHMRFAIQNIAALGIPWLYVWGNHDLLNDYRRGHDAFREAPHSLYRGGPSGGNYVVQILNAHQKTVWRFVCLNSTNKGLQPAQCDWVKALPHDLTGPTGAFAVFHIPLLQYETLWKTHAAAGVRFEAVCNEEEKGTSFAALRSLQGLRACVCGHDHVNDFHGLHEGVQLIYGRATGYGGYGDLLVPKGGKLYTINTETGGFTWESIRANGERWKPTPGLQIDNKKGSPWKREPRSAR